MFIDKAVYFIEVIFLPAKKQITRQMILDAAMELLREGGMEAVSVTSLARRLGCSTQPIYLSFTGMDALRKALAAEATNFFIQEMEADGGADLYGMAYIRFAEREKELFRFLFLRQDAFEEVREALKPMMERSMAALMEEYRITYDQADYLHDQLWMHAHGIASMIATEFCHWNMEKVAGMLKQCKSALGSLYGGTDHESSTL